MNRYTHAVSDVLSHGAELLSSSGVDHALQEAALFLSVRMNIPRTHVFLRNSKPVRSDVADAFMHDIRKRMQGVPAAYIIGSVEFMGIPIRVTSDALIPRPETEIMVEYAIARIQEQFSLSQTVLIADICTGSGAIAIACARFLANARCIAADIDEKALALARYNMHHTHGAECIDLVQTDLLDGFTRMPRFDCIIANPPYLRTGSIAVADTSVRFEPRRALDGGQDGMFFARRIIRDAIQLVRPRGMVFMEIDQGQADELIDLCGITGFTNVSLHRDYQGLERFIYAEKPPMEEHRIVYG
ncbi:MAG: peptide chain release factor N(5)-glutamine methyltransferase [Elusimicrobia bacterium]|nr:peptide chain release factor N(5)-glutamine methyltransferase [Elusimicrobiota bacterium]